MAADGFGLLLYGNGQCQVDQHGILFQNTAAGRELTGICLIVIGRRGNLIAQLIAVFLEKGIDFLTDGGRDFLYKVGESLPAFLCDPVEGGIPDSFYPEETGLAQFGQSCLNREIVGILFSRINSESWALLMGKFTLSSR